MHLILAVLAAVIGNGLQRWTNACDATNRAVPNSSWRMACFGCWWTCGALISKFVANIAGAGTLSEHYVLVTTMLTGISTTTLLQAVLTMGNARGRKLTPHPGGNDGGTLGDQLFPTARTEWEAVGAEERPYREAARRTKGEQRYAVVLGISTTCAWIATEWAAGNGQTIATGATTVLFGWSAGSWLTANKRASDATRKSAPKENRENDQDK